MARSRRKTKAIALKPAIVTPRDLAGEIMTVARDGRPQNYFDVIAEMLLVWLLGEPTDPTAKPESRPGDPAMVPNPDDRWPASGMVRALNRAQELNSTPGAQLLDVPERLKYEEPVIIRFALMDVQHAIRHYIHVGRVRSHSPYFRRS